MKPYKCRPMKKGDRIERRRCQALCEQAQLDYWAGIKAPVVWSLLIWERVEAMRPIIAEDERGKVVGFLLLGLMTHYIPPLAIIQGWATDRRLPHKERLLIGLQMLLCGYDDCVEAGLKQARGDVEATNTPVLDTLRLVESFTIKAEGYVPTTVLTERKPKIYRVDLDITPAYQAALKAAIEKLQWDS